jgi:hypothetical protein
MGRECGLEEVRKPVDQVAQARMASNTHLGKLESALSLLKDCTSLVEGIDPEGDTEFRLLGQNPEFRKLIERVHRHYPAVRRAHVAFTVPEKDIIDEGLAVDRATGALYMGSLQLGKIVKITKTGSISDFVAAGRYNLGPICGLKVDPADYSLWANICPDSGSGAELLHFDTTAKLIERFPPPASGQHLFNELVIRKNDEIYLTDSLANRAYRFDRRTHAFTELALSRAIYYPNGIALSDDGNFLYVGTPSASCRWTYGITVCASRPPDQLIPLRALTGCTGSRTRWWRSRTVSGLPASPVPTLTRWL